MAGLSHHAILVSFPGGSAERMLTGTPGPGNHVEEDLCWLRSVRQNLGLLVLNESETRAESQHGLRMDRFQAPFSTELHVF
jgi:hypothetical protein